MEPYDRGSPVLIEAQVKKRIPFGALEFFDPTSIKITIKDKTGAVKADANDMIKQETGKYYFICQTGINWQTGDYEGNVAIQDASWSDVKIAKQVFRLI